MNLFVYLFSYLLLLITPSHGELAGLSSDGDGDGASPFPGWLWPFWIWTDVLQDKIKHDHRN